MPLATPNFPMLSLSKHAGCLAERLYANASTEVAFWLDHHAASFDKLRMGKVVMASNAAISPMLSLSKHAGFPHMDTQPKAVLNAAAASDSLRIASSTVR
jgi:hypothetical protein